MAVDIFDEIAPPASKDIFDEVDAPKGDVFDEVANQRVATASIPYWELPATPPEGLPEKIYRGVEEFVLKPFVDPLKTVIGGIQAFQKFIGTERPNAPPLPIRELFHGAGEIGAETGRAGYDIISSAFGQPTPPTTVDRPLQARVAEEVGRAAPVIIGATLLKQAGVAEPIAFGAPMYAQTMAETGSPVAALTAGGVGALLPGTSLAGKEGGELLASRLAAKLNIPDSLLGATEAVGKVVGSQSLLNGLMTLSQMPEYIQLVQTDPAKAQQMMIDTVAFNLAFEVPHLPQVAREAMARDRVGQYMSSPEYKAQIDQVAQFSLDPRNAQLVATEIGIPPRPGYRVGDAIEQGKDVAPATVAAVKETVKAAEVAPKAAAAEPTVAPKPAEIPSEPVAGREVSETLWEVARVRDGQGLGTVYKSREAAEQAAAQHEASAVKSREQRGIAKPTEPLYGVKKTYTYAVKPAEVPAVAPTKAAGTVGQSVIRKGSGGGGFIVLKGQSADKARVIGVFDTKESALAEAKKNLGSWVFQRYTGDAWKSTGQKHKTQNSLRTNLEIAVSTRNYTKGAEFIGMDEPGIIPEWQKTIKDKQAEFARSDDTFTAFDKSQHEKKVSQAVALGKPVPPEVLADYLDLAKPAKGAAEVTETGGPGTGVGPGTAHPSDQPSPPPPAIVNASQPHAAVAPSTSILARLRNTLSSIPTMLKGLMGESMPKTTGANREVGEAGVRYSSSREASRPLAAVFASHTLEGTNVDPLKLGAALTEDNLRSVREGFRQQATELTAEGKPEEAAAAEAAADQVRSLIGEKNSPFKTEDEYQDFLADPATKKAVAQHIQQWNETIEPMFREAQGLDPDVELPTRGQQTGARINLKVVFPEDEVRPVKPIGGASLTATFKRKSPFGIKAKGTGEVYEGDYGEIIANTFERQLEIANKNSFDKSLVESGLAVVDKPGQRIEIGGKPAVAFPLSRRLIITTKDGKTEVFPAGQNLYVRSDLAGEYRRASNVDPRANIPVVTSTMSVLNRAALAGLTDFTVHTSNLMTGLFNRPVSGKLLADSLLSATGRADIPVSLIKAFRKAFQNNQAQLAELAKIGALRADYGSASTPLGFTGKLIKSMDKTVRLVLDDTFKSLADQGLVEKTETARREYINQIGQYNRRLQGPAIRFLRDTGFGPFATAGRTFNAMGVKMATLSPNAKASNNLAAAALRANVASKWIGAAVLLGTLNYLLTKDKGGGVMGRPGTPLGRLDTGLSDKNKRPMLLPLFDLLGIGRALRVTGLRAAIDAKRFGLTDADAFDSAARDIINSAVGPAAGPPVRFGMVAATGYPPAVQVGRASPVAPPGHNQVAINVVSALQEANPLIASAFDIKDQKSIPEILSRQLPRFTLAPGKPPEMIAKYPKIVGLAQTHAYADYIVSTARKMEPVQRTKFIRDSLKPLTPEQREMVEDIIKRRKIGPNVIQ